MSKDDLEHEVTAVAICTKCGRERDWPDVAKGAGRPISGDETLSVEHHAACPQCGGKRVWVRIESE
jgi:DNA-directed RNA polymerase subunit RPC12/RpoP